MSLLEHLLAAITVITLTFFLLLDGRGMVERSTGRLPSEQRERARRIANRIAEVVKAYVSVNLLLAIAAGVLAWIFLVYQQLQDRIIQPLLYRGGALKVNPAVAIVAVIVGANLAGVLGALLAIPTAASLGVVIDELVLSGPTSGRPEPEPAE